MSMTSSEAYSDVLVPNTCSIVANRIVIKEKRLEILFLLARGLFFKPICSGVVLVRVNLVRCFIFFFIN